MNCLRRKMPKVLKIPGRMTASLDPRSPSFFRVIYCGTRVTWKGIIMTMI